VEISNVSREGTLIYIVTVELSNVSREDTLIYVVTVEISRSEQGRHAHLRS